MSKKDEMLFQLSGAIAALGELVSASVHLDNDHPPGSMNSDLHLQRMSSGLRTVDTCVRCALNVLRPTVAWTEEEATFSSCLYTAFRKYSDSRLAGVIYGMVSVDFGAKAWHWFIQALVPHNHSVTSRKGGKKSSRKSCLTRGALEVILDKLSQEFRDAGAFDDKVLVQLLCIWNEQEPRTETGELHTLLTIVIENS